MQLEFDAYVRLCGYAYVLKNAMRTVGINASNRDFDPECGLRSTEVDGPEVVVIADGMFQVVYVYRCANYAEPDVLESVTLDIDQAHGLARKWYDDACLNTLTEASVWADLGAFSG